MKFELVFPSLCLHCQKQCSTSLVCEACAPFFELIETKTRCPFCFQENERSKACHKCVKEKRWNVKQGSAISKTLPVLSFLEKSNRALYLAKTASSLMLLQFYRLGWPVPDVICIPPSRLWKRFISSPTPASFLGKHLSKALNSPLQSLLRYKGENIRLGSRDIRGKRILLIDSVKKEALEEAIKALLEGKPKCIHVLTLCD